MDTAHIVRGCHVHIYTIVAGTARTPPSGAVQGLVFCLIATDEGSDDRPTLIGWLVPPGRLIQVLVPRFIGPYFCLVEKSLDLPPGQQLGRLFRERGWRIASTSFIELGHFQIIDPGWGSATGPRFEPERALIMEPIEDQEDWE